MAHLSTWITQALEVLSGQMRQAPRLFITTQIHHFCDASQSAYGAVSYLRLISSDGEIHCFFLNGKSRLAPLKQMTIPRLELAAVTLSVLLNKMLKKELETTIDNITFWTDSMTVIRYIHSERIEAFSHLCG